MIRRNIPNYLTSGNILSGMLSIIMSVKGQMLEASFFILAGALFDLLDGAAARLLQVKSYFGKDLDSLADVITFGTAPAVLMFAMMEKNNAGMLAYLALLIPIFSAWRLAKFNNDARQTENFIGLPTPANGIFFASWPLVNEWGSTFFKQLVLHTYTSALLVIVMSVLLVSELPLFSLKSKKERTTALLFLVFSGLLFLFLFVNAVPLIIILYILIAFVKKLFKL